jgi:hypothetical protein
MHDSEPQPPPRSRDNMLAISLAILVGGIALFYLYLITLGIIGNLLALAGLMILVGALHYLLWGRSLSAEVAAEREALKRQEELESRPKPKTPPGAIQDISRTQGLKKM